MEPVLEFKDYNVAWIAPLKIEKSAALRMLDKIHEGNFRSDPGDDYQYIGGEINGHNIIIASFPPGTPYGGASAAALAAQVKKCLPRMWMGFLVGVAAGLPDIHGKPPLDIRLGDVLVSLPDQDSPGVTQYDFGKQTTEGFENRSRLPPTEYFIRSVLGNIRDKADVRGHTFMKHLQRLQDAKDEDGNSLFEYPGQDKDKLYQTIAYKDDDKIVEREELVDRAPRDDMSLTRVWYGNLGSGNTVMKSCKERDALRDKYKFIGLEMEAHGTMNTIPVGNIRGVCDYADQHKAKGWQPYAAAVAAAYTREVLCSIPPTVEQKGSLEFSDKFISLICGTPGSTLLLFSWVKTTKYSITFA
jgi:nucleoside phosphorylase